MHDIDTLNPSAASLVSPPTASHEATPSPEAVNTRVFSILSRPSDQAAASLPKYTATSQ
ncbi:hypothetical protein BDW74DRAFT_163035 [Aspergillus multicolor]|uniref:uncharacterized protein n=1 Tax=Aspergillus multicolor TaxID=41759 RepID=UPI003CCDE069